MKSVFLLDLARNQNFVKEKRPMAATVAEVSMSVKLA